MEFEIIHALVVKNNILNNLIHKDYYRLKLTGSTTGGF